MNFKPFLRAAGYLTAFSTALGIALPAHATPDNLIVAPGQHLGRVFIGDSKAAVHRRLGTPQRTFKLAGGLVSELWRAKSTNDDTDKPYSLEVVYRSGVVTQIEATNPVFRTQGGLSTDSTPAAWLATLGKTPASKYRYTAKPNQLYYDWMSKGVALELQQEDPDGEENKEADYDYINTVIVHRKGAKVVVDSGGHLIR